MKPILYVLRTLDHWDVDEVSLYLFYYYKLKKNFHSPN